MLEGIYKGVKYKEVEGGFQIQWPSGLVGIVKCNGIDEFKAIIDGV
jgi:hypothetical protein